MAITIPELAEELALEDYTVLEFERELLHGSKGYELETFDLDNDWRDTFADWFDGQRNYYLEQAREIIAQEAA